MEHFKKSILTETDHTDPDLKKSNFNPKIIKNKPWNITKNLQVSYALSNNVFKKIKTKESEAKRKATPTIQQITSLYLDEREWFKKKCEREIGKFSTRKETQISNIEKCLRLQELIRCSKEIRMYREYVQPPRPENVPDVVWNGPLMKHCGCLRNDCECRGNILLPPKHIGYATRYTWRPMYYLRALTCFKKWQPPEPQKTFAQRLHEAVDAETEACKKLKEMGVLQKRGPEFCIYRCFFYQVPEAESDNEYSTLKQQLLEAYKNRKPPPVVDVDTAATPVEEEVPIIDGFYRTLSTQSNTGPNGEFELGKISHVLFARMDESTLCDIEGKQLIIRSYKEFNELAKAPAISSKLENLLSLKGIRSQFSKFTSNFISSFIEIKDTGIPVNSQGTQDPPLDNKYQSIIEIPLKGLRNSNCEHDPETCPCCKYYKTAITPNVFEQNTTKDDYKINENTTDTNAKLIDPQKKKISSEVKNEETFEGVIAEKLNDILSLSGQKNNQQQNVSQTRKFTENELTNVESKKFIEENKCNSKKSSTPLLAEENKKTVYISEPNKKNVDIRNNTSSTDQNNNNYTDNLNNLDDSLKTLSHNDVIIRSNNKLRIDKVNKNKSDMNSLNSINNKKYDNKIKQDLAIAENKPIGKVVEIKTNLNENHLPDINSPEKYGTSSSKADVHMLLNTRLTLNVNSTQKPSLRNLASKESQRFGLRNKVKRALSYDNIKLHVKKSFQKTSSAFSAFFQCVDFTSSFSIRHSKDHNNIQEVLKEETTEDNVQEDFIDVSGNSDKKDSKISEEEMFSLQYNSNLMTDTEGTGINDIVASE